MSIVDGPSDYDSTIRLLPNGTAYIEVNFIPRINPLPGGLRLEELSVIREQLPNDPKTIRTRYVVRERATIVGGGQ